MAIGGFSGATRRPLGEFQADVANHRISYYVAPDTDPDPGRIVGQHTDVTHWVAAHYMAMKAGSDTVYDLTAPPR